MDRAREIGIALDPIQRFAAGDRRADGIVFGYGAIDSARITEAVPKLGALIRRE
jgi:DNA-binding transcriptional MocR family regulator